MRKFLAPASLILLLALITGCRRRTTYVSVPPPPPAPVQQRMWFPHATLADMPLLPPPVLPTVVLGGAVQPSPPPMQYRPLVIQPQTKPLDNTADAATTAAAGEEPPTTTPIGQLSAAPNTSGMPSSASIGQEIQSIQQHLNKIHRRSSKSDQHTVLQIRTFLQKATNALQAGDLDAAHTLTVKARVLLGELQ